MKNLLCLLSLLCACHSGAASNDERDLTSQDVAAYVHAFSNFKKPVDYEGLILQLRKIISPDATFREGTQEPEDDKKFYDVAFEDGYKRLRLHFPGTKQDLSIPTINALTPKRKGLNTCAERPIGFEHVSVRDLAKLYGPWIGTLNGAERESRESVFIFKSGMLEVIADGCYEEPKENIQIHRISVRWPRPEESHY